MGAEGKVQMQEVAEERFVAQQHGTVNDGRAYRRTDDGSVHAVVASTTEDGEDVTRKQGDTSRKRSWHQLHPGKRVAQRQNHEWTSSSDDDAAGERSA